MPGYVQYLEKNIQVKKNLSKERNPTFISTVNLGSTCMSGYAQYLEKNIQSQKKS